MLDDDLQEMIIYVCCSFSQNIQIYLLTFYNNLYIKFIY